MAVWRCPGNDMRELPDELFGRDNYGLEDALFQLKILMEEFQKGEELRLPFVKNMEAVVLGAKIKERKNILMAGDYCYSTIEELENLNYNISDHIYMKTVIECIEKAGDLPVELEIVAPFSVLGALINPAKLFKLAMKEPKRLKVILDNIVRGQIEFITKARNAGIKVISITDSIGEAELVGQKFYKEYSGKVLVSLLKSLQNNLDGTIIHLCGRTTNSLLNTGFIKINMCEVPKCSYQNIIFDLSKSKCSKILGNMCIHSQGTISRIYEVQLT